jgi:hypothetical protein
LTGIATQTHLEKMTSVTIPGRLMLALREEYNRLERESNLVPPSWDDYLSVALSIGLERLGAMSDAEALAVLESEMFGSRDRT